jgi:hypothetical protein
MPDNVGYTPGSGAIIAADEIGGALYQRVKPVVGADGTAVDVSSANPMPAVADRTDNLLVMLSRIVKLLESNAVVDSAQRQRVNMDTTSYTPFTLTGGGTTAGVLRVTLPTDSTGILAGVTTVTNLTTVGGMDREQYINIARNAYANGIRSKLIFS